MLSARARLFDAWLALTHAGWACPSIVGVAGIGGKPLVSADVADGVLHGLCIHAVDCRSI